MRVGRVERQPRFSSAGPCAAIPVLLIMSFFAWREDFSRRRRHQNVAPGFSRVNGGPSITSPRSGRQIAPTSSLSPATRARFQDAGFHPAEAGCYWLPPPTAAWLRPCCAVERRPLAWSSAVPVERRSLRPAASRDDRSHRHRARDDRRFVGRRAPCAGCRESPAPEAGAAPQRRRRLQSKWSVGVPPAEVRASSPVGGGSDPEARTLAAREERSPSRGRGRPHISGRDAHAPHVPPARPRSGALRFSSRRSLEPPTAADLPA